jgi:hypothetical protein
MKVELEMYMEEDDETKVMEKVSILTKHATELGFRINKVELKSGRHEKEEEEEEEREEKESKINEI